MSDKPETDAPGDEAGGAAPSRPSPVAAILALLRGPKKKLIILSGAALLAALVLSGVIALGLSLFEEPPPEPTPVSAASDAAEPAPATDTKTGVEERFEALKRGDFSVLPSNRRGQEAVGGSAPEQVAAPAAAVEAEPPRKAKEAAPSQKPVAAPVVAADGASTSAQTAAASPPKIVGGECAVGASDPKDSAAGILACIREFNAMEARARKPPKKKPPEN